jgi:AraC-like DNA-binding protein
LNDSLTALSSADPVRPIDWVMPAPATRPDGVIGQALKAREMYDELDQRGKRKYTVAQIADTFGVSRKTIYRHLTTGRTGTADQWFRPIRCSSAITIGTPHGANRMPTRN